MLIRSLTLLAALASSAIADVEFVTPAAGSTVAGAKTLSVTWKESGVEPPITSFTTFTLFLVAGGDDVESQVCIQSEKRMRAGAAAVTDADQEHELQVQIALGGQGAFSAGNTASGVVDITFGDEATNA